MNDLEKLFLSKLKHIYDAEQQGVEALSQMQVNAEPSVKNALNDHLEQSREHVGRIERVFDDFGQSAERKTCHALAGILKEGRQMLQQLPGSATLLLSARKVEHYEISSYGSMCRWAE
jgi:ferritin-like metal-binding protein YciE